MRKTIKELRLARGWKQSDLARETNIPRELLAKIESKARGASVERLNALCSALGCRPEELDVRAPKASGGQSLAAGDLLSQFRARPERAPRPDYTTAMRLAALKAKLPGFMRKLEERLAKWEDFLADAPSEANDESLVQLRELHVGCATSEASLDYVGFRAWPVCDGRGGNGSHLLRPVLVTPDWIMFFQIIVLTPKRYRMDALVLVMKPRPTFINLEVDDKWHVRELDEERARAIGLYTIRIPSSEVLTGSTVTERLRAHGFCLP